MAITYHAGRRIQGLSTEVLDTASTIWGTNANQATEDFTTYTDQTDANASWISTNTTYVKGGYTTKKMDMSFRGSNSGLISYDLGVGNVSDTNWILRFTLNYTTYTSGDALGQHWVGLSSLDSSSAYTVNQDSVSIWLNRAGQMKSCSSDNNEMQTNTGADGTDLVISTLYYVDLIRDGTTATYNIYDDSERTSLFSTSTHTIAGTVSGLRYFVVKPEGAGTPGTGNAVGTIDDIVFYNGISSITSKPTNVQVGSRFEETDTRKMYHYTYDWFLEGTTIPPWSFTDDLSSSTPWTSVGSGITVTGGEISMAGVAASGSNYLWRSLSHTLSDTLWTMEFDYKSTGQSGGSVFFPFGVKSSVSPLAPNSGDSLRMRDDTDNALLGSWGSTVGGVEDGGTASIAWTEGSFYYPRVGRINSTTIKYQLFSDSARTSQVGSTLTATISSSITGLDTLVCGGGDGGGGTSTGKISNIYISESDLFT